MPVALTNGQELQALTKFLLLLMTAARRLEKGRQDCNHFLSYATTD
jgi:hypothetical protein